MGKPRRGEREAATQTQSGRRLSRSFTFPWPELFSICVLSEQSLHLEVTFTFSREDYLHFIEFRAQRDRPKYLRRAFREVCILGGLYVVLFLLIRMPDVLAIGLAAFLAICCTVFLDWKRTRRMRRVPEHILGERLMRIGPDGLFGRFPRREVLSYWSGIQEIAEDEGYLFFFTGPSNAYVIPKRAFETAADLAQFRDAANSYWNAGRG